MLDLESAIKHCEEVAEKLEKQVKPYQCESVNKKLYEVNKKEWDSCLKCAKEHRQLARWLEELKVLKEQASGDCISRKATLKAFFDYVGSGTRTNDYDDLCIIVSNMPPVTPQSCDDCISRKAVIEQASDYGSGTFLIPVYAVKALPSVTPQSKTDVLDKIKTEIERRCCITVGEGEPAMTLYDIFQIIDKYKRESEEE